MLQKKKEEVVSNDKLLESANKLLKTNEQKAKSIDEAIAELKKLRSQKSSSSQKYINY